MCGNIDSGMAAHVSLSDVHLEQIKSKFASTREYVAEITVSISSRMHAESRGWCPSFEQDTKRHGYSSTFPFDRPLKRNLPLRRETRRITSIYHEPSLHSLGVGHLTTRHRTQRCLVERHSYALGMIATPRKMSN